MKKIFILYSEKSRKKRADFFLKTLSPKEGTKILDLGGGNGKYINSILPKNHNYNVTISDILIDDLNFAKENFGYKTKQLSEDKRLPFDDNEFDIVFCNSVIEHVTIPKKDVWSLKNSKEFEALSFNRQQEFANEIDRISNAYFVQTPYKYFLVESHSWLPGFIVLFPRPFQIKTIKVFNMFWPKQTSPDWNLLTFKKMQILFPKAKIYREKSLGFTKSLMAIKKTS